MGSRDRVKSGEFKLVGLFKLGTEGDFGAVSFAAFDPHTAQRVFGAPGVFDAINVRVAPGVPLATAKRALEHELNPAGTRFGGFEVSSAAAVADETGKPVDELLGSLNEALLDNTKTPVPDQVSFRCDFPAWVKTHSDRNRRLIEDLMMVERTLDVSSKHGVSSARISQLRREFMEDWQQFCEPDAAPER